MAAAVAAASEPSAQAAAGEILGSGGGATDAVIAGFLAAAGTDPAVLLSPVAVLIAGIGRGVRSFDGRALQPGQDLLRPRGFLPSQPIPCGAYAAVPRSLSVLSLAHAYGARRPLSSLSRLGARQATQQGAKRRSKLIAAVGKRGAATLRGSDIMRALMQAGGPAAGGLLTETDLTTAMPGDEPAELSQQGDLTIARPPFAPAGGLLVRPAQVVVAADAGGTVAALSYAPDAGGIEVAELEVLLPREAVPVRRGVSRTTPGTPLPAAAPIAILWRPAEHWFAAVGLGGARWLPPELPPAEGLREQLEALLEPTGAAAGLGATVQRRQTRLVCAHRSA